MPLTISHPAAVIPLKKFGLPLSALVTGSVIPDFEFFLRFSSTRVVGHTLPGIFLFCLPVGILILFLFHKIIKKPLLALLPQSHRSRISAAGTEFSFFPFRQFIKIIMALLIGILSHLLFDSLTHENSFFTSHISLLSYSIFKTPFGSLRVYFLLQQLLSFIGFLLILRWYSAWYKRITHSRTHPSGLSRNQKQKILVLIMLFTLITIFITVPVITFSGNNLDHAAFFKSLISNTAVVSVSVTLLILFLYSIWWHIFLPDSQKQYPI
ncbi:MAG TPA: DUF4184 family protein [Chitinispirillaceae bacterium]|nr:DUF4184 family protein [Chitinispirillaceae bacterium]